MTVLEATSALYGWFSENDSFNMEKNFIKLIPITETPDEDRAAIDCGLRNWEDMKMIQKNGDYWVLLRKLSTLEQSITINADIAIIISSFTSKYAELIQDNSYVCDPLNIQEKDIQALLGLCGDLIKSDGN